MDKFPQSDFSRERPDNNNSSGDSADIRIAPLLLFIICTASGILMEYQFPNSFLRDEVTIRLVTGLILIIVSGLIALSSIVSLVRNHTPFDPARPTVRIVQDGVFRFSRNPMYLSLLVLQGGAAFLTASIWLLVAAAGLFVLLSVYAVRPEEKYLMKKFGDEYRAYCNSVRRWI